MFKLVTTACMLAMLEASVAGSPDPSFIKQPCFAITTTLFQPLSCSLQGPSYISTGDAVAVGRVPQESDTSASSAGHHPWSHPPVCTGWFAEVNDSICVYTSADFMSGRGISIITTPTSAKEISSLPVMRQPILAANHDRSKLSYTKRLPGKGMSLMSSVNASRGDFMRIQAPLILLREGVSAALSLMELEEMMRVAVSQLPGPTQKLLRQLSARRFKHGAGRDSLFLTGVMANHAGLEIPVAGVEHYGMFDELGLINHSCGPNAFRRADTSSLSLQIVAARDIQKAEEITISYFPSDQRHLHLSPFSIRQDYLLDTQLMRCRCSRCHNTDVSEETTAQIVDLRKRIVTKVQDADLVTSEAADLVKLYRLEGLDVRLADAYETAYQAMVSVGNMTAATRYAEMALEMSILEGHAEREIQEWRELIGLATSR